MNLKKNISKDEWSSFVSDSPQYNIFSDYNYLNILKNKFSNYVLEKNGECYCGLILFEDDLSKVPIIYNSIILNKKITKPHKKTEIISNFLDQLHVKEKKIHIRSHFSLDDIRAFSWFNYHEKDKYKKFRISPFYTGLLELENKTFEEIILNANYSRRREIKIAKENYTTEASNDYEAFDRLNQITFERSKQRNSLEVFFSNELLKKSIANNFGSCFITKNKNGEAVAGSFFIHDKECSYYIAGGYNNIKGNNCAASINLSEHVKYCISKKQKFIDFCGVNSPKRGYFKTSFGIKLRMYFELIL